MWLESKPFMLVALEKLKNSGEKRVPAEVEGEEGRQKFLFLSGNKQQLSLGVTNLFGLNK